MLAPYNYLLLAQIRMRTKHKKQANTHKKQSAGVDTVTSAVDNYKNTN